MNCSIDNCPNAYYAKTFCEKHYARNRKHGDPNICLNLPPGSWHINENGYREKIIKGKKILEHREIIENSLGRKLLRKEIIHHIDENRTNNDPSNLYLTSIREHQRIHAKFQSTETHKQCHKCLKLLLRKFFYPMTSRLKKFPNEDHHHYLCKKCYSLKQKELYKRRHKLTK